MDAEGIIGAIVASIVFIIGLWLAIPGPAELGVLILSSFSPIATDPISSQAMNNGILALQIMGIAMIIGDLVGIFLMFKKSA